MRRSAVSSPQEKNFLQMVVEAGTPGIQKQIVKPESLKGMEARYEQTLQELANVIKVHFHLCLRGPGHLEYFLKMIIKLS